MLSGQTKVALTVIACTLLLAVFTVEYADIPIDITLSHWLGGEQQQAGLNSNVTLPAVNQSEFSDASEPESPQNNTSLNDTLIVPSVSAAVLPSCSPSTTQILKVDNSAVAVTVSPSISPSALTDDAVLRSMLPLDGEAARGIAARYDGKPTPWDCPQKLSPPRQYCGQMAQLQVAGYFRCNQASTVQVCVVNEASKMRGTDAMVAYLPSPDRDILINGQPGALAPRGTMIMKLQDAVVDGANGGAFNGSYYLRLGRVMMSHPGPNVAPKTVAPRVRKMAAVVTIWCDSFQHFMFDCLPRVEFITRALQEDPELKVLVMSGSSFKVLVPMLWEPLGISTDRMIIARGDTVYPADEVLLPYYDEQPFMGSTPPLQALRWAMPMLWAPPAPQTVVLYMGRRGRARTITNEEVMLASIRSALKPEYTLRSLIDPKGWQEHLRLFAETYVMFGPHGGAFSSMAFLRPPAHVLEFLSSNTRFPVRNCYAGMAAGLGLTFWRYAPPKFDYDTPMTVDVGGVLDALRKIGVVQ